MNNLSIQYDRRRFDIAENEAVDRALKYATAAHGDQTRATGDPYVIHPIAVAEIVADWGLDYEAVVAALLHDVVEDTDKTVDDIQHEFGDKVAELVNGLTKLKLSNAPRPQADSLRTEYNRENLRKLLLASTKDFRVMMIKLADRLHNMRTLGALDDEKRARIAWESLEIFAPLADRLGMGQLKGELEDLGFANAQPKEFARVRHLVEQVSQSNRRYLEPLKRTIVKHMKAADIEVIKIEARQKHYYSIYKKLVKTGGDIEKIYDLVAVRIIVATVPDCYQVLGILHQHYKPLIYRIKDYIAVPKPNGYQSLHTTVFADDGRITEIQIRTPEMHQAAEYGLAAHFYYDANKTSATYVKRKSMKAVPASLGWVTELTQLQQAAQNGREFVEGARLELFSGRIFVFSPKGDLYELPEGALPLDFAFAVHSNLGLRALGVKINGRLMPLDTRLENRDVVEVVTRKEAAPSRDWLNLVTTSHAKGRIRSWFRATSRDANIAAGRSAVEGELPTWGVKRLDEIPKQTIKTVLDTMHIKSIEDMYALIGEGTLGLTQVVRRLVPDAAKPKNVPVVKRVEPTGRVLVAGEQLPYVLAQCCKPVYPQPLLGYVTRGNGITVHALGCRNIPTDLERYAECRWETEHDSEVLAFVLEIRSLNRVGLLLDITGVVAAENLSISRIESENISQNNEPTGEARVEIGVEAPDLFALSKLRRALARIAGVTAVHRLS